MIQLEDILFLNALSNEEYTNNLNELEKWNKLQQQEKIKPKDWNRLKNQQQKPDLLKAKQLNKRGNPAAIEKPESIVNKTTRRRVETIKKRAAERKPFTISLF